MSNTTAIISLRAAAVIGAMVSALAACATKPAPEYGGRWKAVNRYADVPLEIPLQQVYQFQPSPMDGTLKAMLERWARDSKMIVSYEHPFDFTLHEAVAGLRTASLQEAVSQLTSAYSAQGVAVTAENNRIVVRRTGSATQ